ncbi:hypothetical protein N0V93_006919 [Gnomoniopsis smithogilvyi]|uniref:Phytanoyl-CoA dioxygenase n=1 Tax=Gnomoniopsis smithogilvyi TaxID=1191159 RepID=A0A9W9CW27_9PEZI|nr:hypothetical protein N0V93_006919 [Gnomoniopsis smithogilvyi]
MSQSDSLSDAKAHLKEHGWVRIPSVLSNEEAENALDRLWKAKAAVEAEGEQTHLDFLDPNPSNVRVFYLMAVDKIFRELISHPKAIDMVKSVLGENFLISNFTANIARPGSESMALHSDQSIVFPDPWYNIWALNVIWCLTDVTKDNGATLYIPGSNKWVTRDEVPRNAPDLVPFEAKAGDIIVMDGRVWHTSGSNITEDQDRALLFGYYTAGFMRQQVNWTAKLSKDIQDTLTAEQKEWLGLGVVGNIGVTGDFRYLDVQYPDVKTRG